MRSLWFVLPLVSACAAAGPTGSIAGHVTLTGRADHSGATVFVIGASDTATTDATGAFTIAGVPVGTRTMIAVASGYETGTVGSIEVRASATTTVPALTLLPFGANSNDGTDGGPSDGGPSDADTDPVPDAGPRSETASLEGTATLINGTDFSGTRVSIVGTDLSTQTAADGSWRIPNSPLGFVTLNFKNGSYQATLPNVLSLPGSTGTLVDTTTWSLVPMDVPRGTRLTAGTVSTYRYDAPASPYVVTTFADAETGVSTTRVISVATGQGVNLEAGANAARLAPDGQHVVYQVNTSPVQIRSMPVTGGSTATLSTGASEGFIFTPDGTRMLYVIQSGDHSEVRSVPIGGGAEVTLLSLPSSEAQANLLSQWGQFSADSSKIVLCSPSGVYITNPGVAPSTARIPGSTCWSPQFTPDGQKVLYQTGNGSGSWNVVTSSGSSAPVSLGTSLSGPHAFLPDGSSVLMSGTNGMPRLLPLTGGAPLWTGDTRLGQVVATPDSAWFVATAGNSVVRVNAATGAVSTLFAPESVDLRDFALAADGHTAVAFAAAYGSPGILVALDVSTATSTTLSTLVDYRSQMVKLASDGQKVAFRQQRPEGLGAELAVVPLSGATAAVAQLYSFQGASFFWADSNKLVAERKGTPAPYRALDGVYRVSLSP